MVKKYRVVRRTHKCIAIPFYIIQYKVGWLPWVTYREFQGHCSIDMCYEAVRFNSVESAESKITELKEWDVRKHMKSDFDVVKIIE